MKEEYLKLIICPKCSSDLDLVSRICDESNRIKSGELKCADCDLSYPIIDYIPRFVPLNNYADNFGLEWTRHALTQYDSYSGKAISETRFFKETKWNRNLNAQYILEAGSGSGRFTEQAASTGAMVVSFDYSRAVETNYALNGKKSNVFIVQADIYNMPFRKEFFDKLFCFGVLQHTPDPQKAFSLLPSYIKKGGYIATDIYRKISGIRGLLQTKYWVRPFTKKIKPELLYKISSSYVKFMWPICKLFHKLPHGRQINWFLLVADYRDIYDLSEDILLEWAVLDTFDVLSPVYDNPQTLDTVKQWFNECNLSETEIHYGYNGIEGRGRKL